MEDYNSEQKEEEELEDSQANSQILGKNQKIAVGVLAVLAVSVVFLWAAQLKNSINGPFVYNPNSDQTDSSSDVNSAEALKTKDTDQDGLTDWDELNTYKTSPYLADSDSDGITDKDEINKGTDPNCPEGRTCSSSASADIPAGSANTGAITGDNTASNSSSTPSGLGLDLNNATGNSSPTQADIQKTLSGQSDVSVLRQMLLDSGMTAEDLNQISDADLMASYNEVLGSQ